MAGRQSDRPDRIIRMNKDYKKETGYIVTGLFLIMESVYSLSDRSISANFTKEAEKIQST